MTVSNPATFSSIKAEFGGSNNFKDYYAGGPYVDTGISASIGTSAATLRMSQFNGVTNRKFSLPTSVTASQAKAGLGATATFTLGTAGTWSGTTSGTWITPTSQASGLDVYVTNNGNAPSGTFNTWLSMTTARTWSIFADAGTSISSTLTFQFRKTGTTTVINTSTVIIKANAPLT